MVLRQFDTVKDSFDIKWYSKISDSYNNTAEVLFFSNTGRKSFGCVLKQLIWTHIYKIILVLAFIGTLFKLTSNFRRKKAVNAFSADFFN